jgi:hypothetical protein
VPPCEPVYPTYAGIPPESTPPSEIKLQFLDIGTGLPTAGNTHQVAQRAAPESRIVYAGHDPAVLAHAQAPLTSSPQGAMAGEAAAAVHPPAVCGQRSCIPALAGWRSREMS